MEHLYDVQAMRNGNKRLYYGIMKENEGHFSSSVGRKTPMKQRMNLILIESLSTSLNFGSDEQALYSLRALLNK